MQDFYHQQYVWGYGFRIVGVWQGLALGCGFKALGSGFRPFCFLCLRVTGVLMEHDQLGFSLSW